ncbi:MAG: FecR domain-containing protein [Chitinispirillaceae bacterium]|nr:FecR domain-containing protein [Chitinispirillaceae bacterium]
MTPCLKSSLLAGCCILLFSFTVQGTELYAVVDSLKGSAEVQRAGRQQWQKAKPKMRLYNNDILHVLTKGYATLKWPDGSATYVHQNSQLLINLVQEEPPEGKIFNHATVFFGAVFFLVKKIVPRGLFDDANMRVYTPTAVMSIRGTAFSVLVDKKGGATRLQVINGTVQVRNILKTVSLFLGPAHATVVSMNTDPTPPMPVLKKDIESLRTWIPADMLEEAMKKQLAQSRKDHLTITGKLKNRCVVTLFSNNSSYHGNWPISAHLTRALTERLGKAKPQLAFVVTDSIGPDPFQTARSDSARYVILGSIDVFDITQRAEISPRADEYREFANAEVRIRLRLLDAASQKQLAEETYAGEVTSKNAAENSWQKIQKMKFDMKDKTFASTILGGAINEALDASQKIARYIE